MIGRFILDIGPERITATREDDGTVLSSAYYSLLPDAWLVGMGEIRPNTHARAMFANRADACSVVIDYAKKHVMDAIKENERA